jgi:hypothetical protein
MTKIFVFMIELSHLTKNNPHLVSKSHLPQFGNWNHRHAEAGDLCLKPASRVGAAHLRDGCQLMLEARVTTAGYGGAEVRAGVVMQHGGVRSQRFLSSAPCFSVALRWRRR